ncbi:MAG: hypothetical protein WC476_01605 [Phycisphaerae bacterium]|jgi:carbamoylphosphate synthase large subunit
MEIPKELAFEMIKYLSLDDVFSEIERRYYEWFFHTDERSFTYGIRCWKFDDKDGTSVFAIGETRQEAVAKALVKILEKEDENEKI